MRGTLVHALARLYPWAVADDADLDRALSFLDAPLTATEVIRAGYGAGLALLGTGLACLVAVPQRIRPVVLLAAGLAAFGAMSGVPATVRLAARARRTSALGAAPGLVSRAVLRMRLAPAPEAAATFAAETGTGPLAASLREHVRRTTGTGATGLDAFGREWGTWFPALRRSLALVGTAGAEPAGERARTLDRALDAVLDGTRDSTAEFAVSVRRPATAVYAFGVLLPLALVALLPAASAAGVGVSTMLLVVGYDLLLPLAVAGLGAWLLARRPVAFPAPAVPRTHPDLPDGARNAVLAGVGAGILAGVVATTMLSPWTVPLAVGGATAGAALFVRYRPAMAVRRRVTAVEDGLDDALALVGRRVQRGQAVETAVERAADELTGETATVFAAAARRQRQLGVGVRAAFLDDHGALSTIPSARARSVAELLALAATEGRPAGAAVVSMAEHLSDLGRVEEETRRDLASVTGTLLNTAAVFAPLVAGATVALADAIGRVDAELGGSVPETSTLGLTVGVYVLVLAALLSALASGLERGFDRTLVGYRAGGALLSATTVFLVTQFAVGLFV
ncbi:type II secretion system protein [Haloarculaceae archaeon H-GB2-1]|nr:type II secretion system protein [Haloarculaceae archaeon H-GB1-1]MEA5387711.1 type II secretion system protein [Haloarculaceae archaeon H-GB11]MEA5409203.1 type II secretion system protein [Haloarculaceae archaeon H-GB2-1]